MMKSMRKQTRRPTTNLVRRMRGRPSRTLSADYVDLNPSSEEDRESEDSDKDLTSYQCTNCSATGRVYYRNLIWLLSANNFSAW